MKIPYRTNSTNKKLCSWSLLRLERAVSRLAARNGYDGDPLADPIPPGRTLGELAQAHGLLQLLPASLRNSDRNLAMQMCQGVVFGSTRPGDGILASRGQTSPTVNRKLARERSRNRSGRAGR